MFVGILSREPNIICLVVVALNLLSRNGTTSNNNRCQEFVDAQKCNILTHNNTNLTFYNWFNYFARISNIFYFFKKLKTSKKSLLVDLFWEYQRQTRSTLFGYDWI